MIREMRNRGMKITEIAKELGTSRPTARKYLKSRKPPEFGKKETLSEIPASAEKIDVMLGTNTFPKRLRS